MHVGENVLWKEKSLIKVTSTVDIMDLLNLASFFYFFFKVIYVACPRVNVWQPMFLCAWSWILNNL